MDCTRKRWASAEAYVRARLGGAKRNAALSKEEAAKHIDYVWELLSTQTITIASDCSSSMDLWAEYAKFAEKKLGRALRRVAVKYNTATPAVAASQSTRRCDACGAAEGAALDADGGVGAKLRSCACNPGGGPFFCNTVCQRAGWPAHRDFCTAAPAESKGKSKK